MRVDLIVALILELPAYVGDGEAAAGAGEGESSFERGWGCHAPDMGAAAKKPIFFFLIWISG